MDTPLSPPFDFWDETMKRKRGERRREEEQEEENGHDPLYIFGLDSPLPIVADEQIAGDDCNPKADSVLPHPTISSACMQLKGRSRSKHGVPPANMKHFY